MPVGIFDPIRVPSRRSSPVDSQTKKGMVNLMKQFVSVCVAMGVVLMGPAVVPEAAAQGLAPAYYGTADTNYHYVSAEEFQSTFNTGYIHTEDGFWRGGDGLIVTAMAPLRLPSGALVDGYSMVYDDSDAGVNCALALNRYWVGAFGATGTSQIGTTFTSSGAPGVTSTWVDLDPDITIRYYISATFSTQSYAFIVGLPNNENVRFRGVIVHWKRQVSPAPATATFNDVPTGHWAFRFIEALADSGITAGCGGGSFCPNNTLTRAEMAVFLAKALGLHYAP